MAWLRRLYGICAVIFLLFLTSDSLGQAPTSFRIDEQQIKFRVNAHPVLELPIVNTSGKALVGQFRLELLDTNNKVESVVTGTFQDKPGTTIEKIGWPLDYLVTVSPSSLGWRRLHYSFILQPELGVAPAEGFVQLSRVLVGVFEVRMTAASKAKPGNKFPVRIRVDDPSTGKALHGTPVELALTLGDDDDHAIKHTVTTDHSGYAVYSFDLPTETDADEGTVTAEAKRGPYSEQVELSFDLRSKGKLTLTTDKPLYQPGQIAHLRVLAFGPDKHALASKELVVAIEDEDGDEQFHETLKTSRFGVASADWDIPQKLRLGNYEVHTALRKSEAENNTATILVNGMKLKEIGLPQATQVVGPRAIDFGQDMKIGTNKIDIQQVGDSSSMQTNVITSYYIPWSKSEATDTDNFKSGETRALKLKVIFGRREARIGDTVTCRVEAERIGFAGYGMMIAEIGMPPGAEVDRESLEKAKDSGVDGYEVQPDRVVFYLWPSAGGSKFQFTFRTRYGMNAMSAPSVLYDYYNPDAKAVVVPTRFTILQD